MMASRPWLTCHFLARFRAAENELVVDARMAGLCGKLVEVRLRSLDLVIEQVSQADDVCACIGEHAGSVGRAPATAAEQAHPNRRIGLRAAREAGIHDGESGGAQEGAAVQTLTLLLHETPWPARTDEF